MRYVLKILIPTAIIGMMLGLVAAQIPPKPVEYKAKPVVHVPLPPPPEKTEEELYLEELEEYLDRLAMCESSNVAYAINHNDGGSPSYGLYQFKITTAYEKLEKYGLWRAGWEESDLLNYLLSDQSRELAREILIRDGEWWRWSHCAKKIKLDIFIKNRAREE